MGLVKQKVLCKLPLDISSFIVLWELPSSIYMWEEMEFKFIDLKVLLLRAFVPDHCFLTIQLGILKDRYDPLTQRN